MACSGTAATRASALLLVLTLVACGQPEPAPSSSAPRAPAGTIAQTLGETTCDPSPALTPPPGNGPGNSCKVLAPISGTTSPVGLLLRGDVLAPDHVYRGGEVLIAANGTIACVGCDCPDVKND